MTLMITQGHRKWHCLIGHTSVPTGLAICNNHVEIV